MTTALRPRFVRFVIVLVFLGLAGCSGGGAGDGSPQPGDSHWGDMRWDQDNWS